MGRAMPSLQRGFWSLEGGRVALLGPQDTWFQLHILTFKPYQTPFTATSLLVPSPHSPAIGPASYPLS